MLLIHDMRKEVNLPQARIWIEDKAGEIHVSGQMGPSRGRYQVLNDNNLLFISHKGIESRI